ncbi:glycosyltransferase [Mucilaginibacter ximonensis]|uniref:Glycosyltransferase n=1 Tax=Mucilaginibacter ximonensis TaxID=538021 RepID=A0ABW5YGC6_9SPHI
MADLSVSVVLYHTDKGELYNLLKSFIKSNLSIDIFLIDNSASDELREISLVFDNSIYIFNGKNIGYGAGHNIAINRSNSKYHLIVNADIEFDPQILNTALEFMNDNPDVGMISPQIILPNGEMQFFCRKLPTPFDLFARRFIPSFIKPIFKKQLDEYLLADRDYSKPMNIPNLPGCFMFMRMSVLKEVAGFDENFFMYVEDIDLTRRIHEKSKTLYLPEIKIAHGLARGSYKFSKLMLYHIQSAAYYFNKWGWFNDEQRVKINKAL